MVYFKLMAGHSFDAASRNKRELSEAYALGYEITVLCSEREHLEKITNYNFVYDGFIELSYSIPRFKRYLIFLWNNIQLVTKVKQIDKDVMSCHDLNMLFLGWLSNFLLPKEKKAKLIYDSHEFELGRYSDRSKIALWYIRHLEHYLIKRCIFTIVVNDCIANEVKKTHHLNSLPVVVRSTPNYWNIDDLVTSEIHRDYCKQLGIPEESFIIMYHGGVMRGRGIETIVKLLAINRNITGVVLGNGEEEYINSLKELAIENGVEGRILFHPAVPLSELWKYVGAANIGMIMAPATCKNHLYSLPNKFFENIQSETPVICPFYPAMKELVDRYNVGLTCNPDDLENINICVEKMRADASFYEQCKKNLKIAKKDLCWENEKQVLNKALQRCI